jgi:uncharacterized UPF0146 family protein
VKFQVLTPVDMKVTSVMLGRVTDVSEVLTARAIALMIQTVKTSETSANFCNNTTGITNPEDSHLHLNNLIYIHTLTTADIFTSL